jgi:hypothetical protein
LPDFGSAPWSGFAPQNKAVAPETSGQRSPPHSGEDFKLRHYPEFDLRTARKRKQEEKCFPADTVFLRANACDSDSQIGASNQAYELADDEWSAIRARSQPRLVFLPGEGCGVRCKIQMQGFLGSARYTKSHCCEHQAEPGAAVPSTRSTFAHYQPQSSISLVLSKLRIGLEKSEWSREIAGFKIFRIPPLPGSLKARLFFRNSIIRY